MFGFPYYQRDPWHTYVQPVQRHARPRNDFDDYDYQMALKRRAIEEARRREAYAHQREHRQHLLAKAQKRAQAERMLRVQQAAAATTIASAWRGMYARKQRVEAVKTLCEAVSAVQDDVLRLWQERGPEQWEPSKAERAHRVLVEMLMQCMLKLDALSVRGSTEARHSRKQLVRQVHNFIEQAERALQAHLILNQGSTHVVGSDAETDQLAVSDSEAWSMLSVREDDSDSSVIAAADDAAATMNTAYDHDDTLETDSCVQLHEDVCTASSDDDQITVHQQQQRHDQPTRAASQSAPSNDVTDDEGANATHHVSIAYPSNDATDDEGANVADAQSDLEFELHTQLAETQRELQHYKQETERLRAALRQAHHTLLNPKTSKQSKLQRKAHRSKQGKRTDRRSMRPSQFQDGGLSC